VPALGSASGIEFFRVNILRKSVFIMNAHVIRVKKILIAVMLLGISTAGVIFSPAQGTTAPRHITIHYYRATLNSLATAANGVCAADPCGKYDGWNFWVWGAALSGYSGSTDGFSAAVPIDSMDKFGAKATFEIGSSSNDVGLLARIGSNWAWAKADIPVERYIKPNPTGDTEVWIKEGDPLLYTSNPNDRVLRIHYNRSDNKYSGWDIQTQESNPTDNKAVAFSTRNDCFGRVATIQVPEISQSTQDYILRKGGNSGTLKSHVLTANLNESKYTDVWLNANLFLGEDTTIDEGDSTFLYLNQQDQNPIGNLVVVHYSRPLQDYSGWTMTTLADGIKHKFTAVDPLFGRLGCAYVLDLTATTSIIKVTNGSKVDLTFGEASTGLGGQRTLHLTGVITDVWLKQGRRDIWDKEQEPDPAVKAFQKIGKVVTHLKVGKSAAIPMKSNANLKLSWYVITPANCKISAGKVIARKPGICKLDVTQVGNAAFNAFTLQYRITIS